MATTTRMTWFHRLIFVSVGGVLAIAAMLTMARAQAQTGDTVMAQEALAVARVISYQGRLVDPATGLAKPDGQYPMSFRLYTVAAGGGPLYTEARTVDVVRSIFSVPLGEVTPLDPNIFNGQPLFLGVTVGGDAEMTPRLRLAHAPYAIFAERAGVANSAALATTVVDGAITSAKIAANAVDSARVVDGSLTGVDIADGSVTSADISDGAGSGLDADYFDGRDSTMLPVAFGFINSKGDVTRATKGVSSIWETGLSCYAVTIEGEPYFWTDYVTTVTQANSTDTKGCDRATVSTGDDSKNLLVYFVDSSGAPIQCNFQFVTYKP